MFDIKRVLFLNCKNVWKAKAEIYLCLNLFVAMAGALAKENAIQLLLYLCIKFLYGD